MALKSHIIQTTNINKLEHKFMKSGHFMMAVDSIHSVIENTKINILILYS